MESICRSYPFLKSLLLVLSLMIALSPPVAFAQNAAVGNVPALAGAVASVPVDLAVNQTIRGFDFRLQYNPATVSFFKMVLEELGTDWFVESSVISPGIMRVSLKTGTPRLANGRIGSLVFTVSQTAPSNTESTLTISDVILTLADGTTQAGTGSDGGIRPTNQLAQPLPPFPPSVSAQAESSSTIRLTWNTPPGATSFVLFSNGAKAYEGSEKSFVSTNLSGSTQYCFSARALGAVGQSAPSGEVCATTPAQCTAPASAPSLNATAMGTSRVLLSWNTTTNASGYRLLRDGVEVYSGTATTFTDEGRSAGTNYCYTIRGTSSCGDGPVSGTVCAMTESACSPPGATPALRTAALSPAVISLEWDNVDGATSYEVTRDNLTVFEGSTNVATDVALGPQTEYCYTLHAKNACGQSTSSSTCATTRSSVNKSLVFSHLAGPLGGADSHDGIGSSAGFSRPASIAIDASGNAYVADTDNQTIRKVSPAGVVTTIAGTPERPGSVDGPGNQAKFFGPEGVAVDGAGNVYVADSQNATIRKVAPDGTVTTVAGSSGVRGAVDGPIGSAVFFSPVGIAVDSSGRIYVSDLWNQTIRRIADGQVTTIAGATGQSGSSDGTGAAARFNLPSGIGVDGAGNVYVAEFASHTIRKVTPNGVVTTLAGLAGVQGSADGTGSAARFHEPFGVAVDNSGNVYVADQGNSTIRKITPAGVVTTFAGSADNKGSTDGVGGAARFFLPKHVGVDGSGNVWVADTGNSTVRRITPSAAVTTIAGEANRSGAKDGSGTTARFNAPNQIALNAAGSIIVADGANHLIRSITPGGNVTTLAGVPEQPGTTDGAASSARFRDPLGVAVDLSGNTWVADWGNHTIRRIATNGSVTTVAGMPDVTGSSDGTGSSAKFHGPRSVASDASGNIYVSDRENHTIRKITPGGVVTTFAGVAGQNGNADGQGSSARFTFPHGLAMDKSGNLIVTDWGNHMIRKITPNGMVTTLAGSPGVSGVSDGSGAQARFSGPQGVAVDENGDIYIADSWNHTIRKIEPDGSVTTVAGMPRGVGSRDGWGSSSRFNNPIGVAVAPGGIVYVADALNHSMRRAIDCPANSLCLGDGRFALSLEASDPRSRAPGSGLPIPQTDLFGYFAIPDLTGNPDNPEVFVKMLDGSGFNGKQWVFYGGLTDFEYNIVVTDTSTGQVNVYKKPGFEFCGGADTVAFSSIDPAAQFGSQPTSEASFVSKGAIRTPSATGPCDPTSELCLLGGKFAVSLAAKDPRTSNPGTGLPIPQSDLFGYFAIPDLTGNPENPEIFVKLLDGRGFNGKYWVFYGGLTDFEVTLTVRDTESSDVQTYKKDGGSFCGGADTTAF